MRWLAEGLRRFEGLPFEIYNEINFPSQHNFLLKIFFFFIITRNCYILLNSIIIKLRNASGEFMCDLHKNRHSGFSREKTLNGDLLSKLVTRPR